MEENRKVILDLLLNKSALKQDVATDCEALFLELKECVKTEIEALKKEVKDSRIRLEYKEIGSFEMHVFIGSDALVFHLHNNVFQLPDDNPLWGTRYFRENDQNGYFGTIYMYNFLAESFIQNRANDLGYLIGRLFINHERHFMMEGKGNLGSTFRDVENMVLNKDILQLIVQSAFAFALDFDLYIPPYEYVSELTVEQMQTISNNLQFRTGKRLGFKMKTDDSEFL